jgi:hypothetical protein
MKYILILILVLIPAMSYSQNCSDCLTRENSYFVCKDGEITTLCIKDPNKLPSGYKLTKKCLNSNTLSSINYNDSGLVYNTIGYTINGGAFKPIFNSASCKGIIQNMLAEWMNICRFTTGINNSGCQN